MADNTARRKQRAALFMRQDGKCFYCKCDMILMMRVSCNFKAPNLCTVEHLDDRFSPSRGKTPNEFRRVAACSACNHERGRLSQASQPIDELHRRAGGHNGSGRPA